ncbi:hypothetical protein F2Q70_00017877 [Brassica cretica]|uniref:Uncharacterized protein n=1 Tax=Brassica cretica TaxID=69181 RepID=A0A8S9HTV2_BRACR|nr:hypothetical protein F2Q70_00017877 [Brassica cretica]
MHGLMSYRRFGRARSLRSDRAEHAFGLCVATLFELLSDVSCFLRKAFLSMVTPIETKQETFRSRFEGEHKDGVMEIGCQSWKQSMSRIMPQSF